MLLNNPIIYYEYHNMNITILKDVKGVVFDFDGTLVDSIPHWYGMYDLFLVSVGAEPGF